MIPERIVELTHISKQFTATDGAVISDLSLSVYRGELLCLLGPSGCGKTTTLRLLAGFEIPDGGTIRIDGVEVAGAKTFIPPEKRGLGVVFQEYALFPHYTVAENVAFGLHKMPRAERAKRVTEVLELVGMGALGKRYPYELSGGQQQRVALARALAPRPVVVLLDEPFSNLDADLRVQMRDEVKRILHEANSTAIFVTHDQQEALALGDRVAIMYKGQLEQVDRPERVFHIPATRFVADFLGLADFIHGRTTPHGLETEIGFIDQPTPYQPGRDIEVMIRPHDIQVRPNATGNGKIVRHDFFGAEHLYRVELPSGQLIHSTQPHTVMLPIGSRVQVTCEAGHTLTCFEGEHAVICPPECELPILNYPHPRLQPM